MCVQYCERNGQTIEDKEDPFHLFSPCGCKFALSVFFWITTLTLIILFILFTRRRHRLRDDDICIAIATFIINFIFLLLTYLAAGSKRHEGFSTWRCVPIGAFIFPWWNLSVFLIVVLLVPPINPGHFHDLNLRRRRQG